MIFLCIVNINKNRKKTDVALNAHNRATYLDQTQAIM